LRCFCVVREHPLDMDIVVLADCVFRAMPISVPN
jgi:hypothetical protein